MFLMNLKVVDRLKEISDNNKKLFLPCHILILLFMLFYYIFFFIFSNRRRIAAVFLVGIVFSIFSSFTAIDIEEEEARVYVNTDEGAFVVEEIDADRARENSFAMSITSPESGERDAEVSINDLIAAMNVAKENRGTIENDFQADDSAKIYDEEKGYLKATYKDDWSLILINKEHHIPDDYVFELATIRGQIKSDVRVMPYVLNMINAAKDDGVTIYIC